MHTLRGIDQLRGNAHAATGFAYCAFEDIADAEFTADLFHVDGLPLVRKTRIAGDDEHPANAAERGDDLLDHAVGEILLLWVAAHIGKGQDRDGWLVGEG